MNKFNRMWKLISRVVFCAFLSIWMHRYCDSTGVFVDLLFEIQTYGRALLWLFLILDKTLLLTSQSSACLCCLIIATHHVKCSLKNRWKCESLRQNTPQQSGVEKWAKFFHLENWIWQRVKKEEKSFFSRVVLSN